MCPVLQEPHRWGRGAWGRVSLAQSPRPGKCWYATKVQYAESGTLVPLRGSRQGPTRLCGQGRAGFQGAVAGCAVYFAIICFE